MRAAPASQVSTSSSCAQQVTGEPLDAALTGDVLKPLGGAAPSIAMDLYGAIGTIASPNED
jgi:hypothetical protein